jgi:hypothetical protein
VGIAPLFLATRGVRGGVLAFVGHENSDYQDFVIDCRFPSVAEALLIFLGTLPEPWHVFRLHELPEWSVARGVVEGEAAFRQKVLRLDPTLCPGLIRTGKEMVFESYAGKTRMRRERKRLERAGHVETLHLRTSDEILPRLEAFFEQHERRWSATRTPSLFREEANRTFYRCLVEHLGPPGRILFTVLMLDGQPIAHHFGFLDGQKLLFYKPTYDIQFHSLSPGTNLLRELWLLCETLQLKEMDYTRGDEWYKERFANHVDANANYVWYRRRWDRVRGDVVRRLRCMARRAIARRGRTRE